MKTRVRSWGKNAKMRLNYNKSRKYLLKFRKKRKWRKEWRIVVLVLIHSFKWIFKVVSCSLKLIRLLSLFSLYNYSISLLLFCSCSLKSHILSYLRFWFSVHCCLSIAVSLFAFNKVASELSIAVNLVLIIMQPIRWDLMIVP